MLPDESNSSFSSDSKNLEFFKVFQPNCVFKAFRWKGKGVMVPITVNCYLTQLWVPVGHVTLHLLMPCWMPEGVKLSLSAPVRNTGGAGIVSCGDVCAPVSPEALEVLNWGSAVQKCGSCCHSKHQQNCWLRAGVGLGLSPLEPLGISCSFCGSEGSRNNSTELHL